MPRDRSRGRVARPDDTAPAEDGSDDADDDGDPTPDLSERDGTIDDLLDDQVGNVEQQVLSGSQANLRIAPEVNPGFVDTEVVNRMGLVLSLNLEFDPSRQQWVPAVVDKTERQAVEQTLTEDRATDDLSGPVDPGDKTRTNDDGDLELQPDDTTEQAIEDAPRSTLTTSRQVNVDYIPDQDRDEIVVEYDLVSGSPGDVVVVRESDVAEISRVPFSDGTQTLSGPFSSGTTYRLEVESGDGDITVGDRDLGQTYLDIDTGRIEDFTYGGYDNRQKLPLFSGFGTFSNPESGTATTSFDNPCTASSTRTAQHDVCSKSSDVTVDLYNGDPNSSDSTLLARNIDQREDISDLPDAFTDLQYKLTLRRDDSGESPRVSRLGHQLIR